MGNYKKIKLSSFVDQSKEEKDNVKEEEVKEDMEEEKGGGRLEVELRGGRRRWRRWVHKS